MSVDTICALATAPGGALGIIRISGAQSLEILSRIFTKDLTTAQPNTVHYGHIVDKTSNLQSPTFADSAWMSHGSSRRIYAACLS